MTRLFSDINSKALEKYFLAITSLDFSVFFTTWRCMAEQKIMLIQSRTAVGNSGYSTDIVNSVQLIARQIWNIESKNLQQEPANISLDCSFCQIEHYAYNYDNTERPMKDQPVGRPGCLLSDFVIEYIESKIL